MRLQAHLLASTSFLVSSLSVSAWAQTPPLPPQPSSPSEAPAPTAPPPSTADQAPTNPAPATSSAAKPAAAPAPANATTLPTITVSAPPPPKRNPPPPPSQPAAAPTPPSSYDTGAPNVAGGPTVAPSRNEEAGEAKLSTAGLPVRGSARSTSTEVAVAISAANPLARPHTIGPRQFGCGQSDDPPYPYNRERKFGHGNYRRRDGSQAAADRS